MENRIYKDVRIRKSYSYFVFFAMDSHELGKRIGFYDDTLSSGRKWDLIKQVAIALLKNGLLVHTFNLENLLHNDGHFSSSIDFDPENLASVDKVDFIISNKGTSPNTPILLFCTSEWVCQVEECIVRYLNSSSMYLEQYESREIVGRESRTINGKTFDVVIVFVELYDIFGRIISHHLTEWFFLNSKQEEMNCHGWSSTGLQNWNDKANVAIRMVVEKAYNRYPVFAAAINEINSLLSEEDVFDCYKDDPYKGVIATSLWLGKHMLTPREFGLLASSNADIIRCQIRYWTKLLKEEGVRPAFYASAGYLYESRKPLGVETSAIFTLPPWELLHFLDEHSRIPILCIQRHYSMLEKQHSEKIKEWYSRNDKGELVPNKNKMDEIFFDYCL